MSRADHMDVAAYALGVLDPQDTERFEEHLATCWACAAELETMVPVVGLLSDIDGETMMAMEHTATDPALLDRTLVAVRTHRRRARMRQVLSMAAAVVAVGALSGIGVSVLDGDRGKEVVAGPSQSTPSVPGPQSPQPTRSAPGPGVGGPNDIPGEQYDAVDSGTGVRATMWLANKEYGTWIGFNLTKLPGPRTCRLVVIRKNDTSEVISTWAVPGTGYGTNTNPQDLQLEASTAAAKNDIAKLQVQSVDANGVASPLVTVVP
ncbi:anti-sigma factor [Micromonospora sp. KC721]|uniref:anti-sigma factor family protein n=1 Tax=Micromonospora sp. KC721 TaxID=2530380 RepID=UPI001043F45E|nr:zf-HC2 domain-containing protein [Micromonospora sp. KC721]TDB78688.1 RNA polymerase subunit sigma [Micromonospora sp. KC721]